MNFNFADKLKTTLKQQRNHQLLMNEGCIILGSVLLSEGIIALLPQGAPFYISIGLILLMVGILTKSKVK